MNSEKIIEISSSELKEILKNLKKGESIEVIFNQQ